MAEHEVRFSEPQRRVPGPVRARRRPPNARNLFFESDDLRSWVRIGRHLRSARALHRQHHLQDAPSHRKIQREGVRRSDKSQRSIPDDREVSCVNSMAAGLRYADRAPPPASFRRSESARWSEVDRLLRALTLKRRSPKRGPHRVPELCRGVLHGPGEGGFTGSSAGAHYLEVSPCPDDRVQQGVELEDLFALGKCTGWSELRHVQCCKVPAPERRVNVRRRNSQRREGRSHSQRQELRHEDHDVERSLYCVIPTASRKQCIE